MERKTETERWREGGTMVREKMERKIEMEGGRNDGEREDGEKDRDGGREERW